MATQRVDGSEEEDAEDQDQEEHQPNTNPIAGQLRSASLSSQPMRVVWGVFNNSNQCVDTWPYPRRKDADAHAAKLTADKKSTHFVQPVKEPIPQSKPAKIKLNMAMPTTPSSPPPSPVFVNNAPVSPPTFPDVRRRINTLLVERGFCATNGPLTTTWARDPTKDKSPACHQGFWVDWPGPRWVLTADYRPGDLWFGVENKLLLNALQRRKWGHPPPRDLPEAFRLAANIPELADLCRLNLPFPVAGESYHGAPYRSPTLTDHNLECVVSDVVDAFVEFVSGSVPWKYGVTGHGPINDFPGDHFPDRTKCPFHSFWLLADWLDRQLRSRDFVPVGWVTVQGLSWHPPPSHWAAPKDVAVKLCYAKDGRIWFTVRKDYANHRSVPATLFDPDQFTIQKVQFNGLWVRYTERSRHRVLGVLLALSRAGWVASASATEPGASPANALHGSTATRWSTGAPQAPGQWFQVNLGSPETFRTIVLNSSSSPNDYPRGYAIYVSDNGTTWPTNSIATGPGSGPITTITLAQPVQTRFVRVVQTGSHSTDWWSIQEFNLSM